MTAWEYKVWSLSQIKGGSSLEAGLNRLGRNGWDLVEVSGAFWIFKRPLIK